MPAVDGLDILHDALDLIDSRRFFAPDVVDSGVRECRLCGLLFRTVLDLISHEVDDCEGVDLGEDAWDAYEAGHTPAYVEVEYQIGTHPSQVMRGFLHDDQWPTGPALVMNPDAHDMPHACCWSVNWRTVRRVTVLVPGVEPGPYSQWEDGDLLAIEADLD